MTPEIVRDSLSFVRFQIYVELKLMEMKGKLTYSDLLQNYRKNLSDIKRKLESRHKLLKLAVASWASGMLIKEALRRDLSLIHI